MNYFVSKNINSASSAFWNTIVFFIQPDIFYLITIILFFLFYFLLTIKEEDIISTVFGYVYFRVIVEMILKIVW